MTPTTLHDAHVRAYRARAGKPQPSRLLLAMIAVALSSGAQAATIGIDTVSLHIPQETYLSGINPGAYVLLDNGASFGAYRNSFGRVSAWAGYTAEYGPAALTLGAVSGYQIKRTYGAMTCGQEGTTVTCSRTWTDLGHTKGPIGPLFAPSVRLPQVLGFTARITVLPKFSAKGHTVAHLSIERTL